MRRTRTRTAIIFAASVGALAAAGTITAVLVTSEDTDPNQDKVTSLCREAAADEPAMSEGVDQFTVAELTHETEDGATFYRALGTAETSDGYGGTRSYTFDCQTKLTGNRWELIDITML